MAMNEKRLGEVVQLARKAAGLTQQELCQKCDLSYSTLAKIERGAIKAPSIFTIQIIAATLGISLDELMQSVPLPSVKNRKKVSKSGVRFVYFDMNGCLVRFFNRAFAAIARDSGATTDVIEALYLRYDEDVCSGTVSPQELNNALSDKLGIAVDWTQYYLQAVEATPGMDELVQWVAENYHIGILTNTMPNMVGPLLEKGILPNVQYDAIIDSSVVQCVKPDPQIFELAAQAAGVKPGEIILIDDTRVNLVAAGKQGWHAMSFDALHPEEAIVAISTALQPAD
jgi:FMN phosphatase YigB (HAD superfamily)/DNA-binding XRE family transcriptional regulator